MHKAFGALNETGQLAFYNDLIALIERLNRAKDGTMVVPSEYLEIIATRS